MGPGSHAIGRQFVVGGSVAERSLIKIPGHGTSSGFAMPALFPGAGNRRSRVVGKVGWVSSAGGAIVPCTGSHF